MRNRYFAFIGFFLITLLPANLSGLDIPKKKLTQKCRELKKEYGEFGLMITHPQTGLIRFEYPQNLLHYRQYCPGSLLKPFSLTTYSRLAPLKKNRIIFCEGFFEETGKNCWLGPGHGNLDLVNAIALSCNLYFHRLAEEKIQPKEYYRVLEEAGILRMKETELTGEDFFKSTYGLGTTIQTTPFKMLFAYHSFFNGGRVFNDNQEMISVIEYSSQLIDVIKDGMRNAYLYGTAKQIYEECRIPDIMAKTGTGASVMDGEFHYDNNVGWVVLFSPSENPTFGMLVIIEKTKGSSTACLLSASLLNFLKK